MSDRRWHGPLDYCFQDHDWNRRLSWLLGAPYAVAGGVLTIAPLSPAWVASPAAAAICALGLGIIWRGRRLRVYLSADGRRLCFDGFFVRREVAVVRIKSLEAEEVRGFLDASRIHTTDRRIGMNVFGLPWSEGRRIAGYLGMSMTKKRVAR